jgi:hypothetical protein
VTRSAAFEREGFLLLCGSPIDWTNSETSRPVNEVSTPQTCVDGRDRGLNRRADLGIMSGILRDWVMHPAKLAGNAGASNHADGRR